MCQLFARDSIPFGPRIQNMLPVTFESTRVSYGRAPADIERDMYSTCTYGAAMDTSAVLGDAGHSRTGITWVAAKSPYPAEHLNADSTCYEYQSVLK